MPDSRMRRHLGSRPWLSALDRRARHAGAAILAPTLGERNGRASARNSIGCGALVIRSAGAALCERLRGGCYSTSPLGLRGLARVLARDQDQALELGDEDAVLVEDAGVDLDDAAVGLRFRGLDVEHLGLAEEGVAVEDRVGVAEFFGRQVGDRLAGDVGDRHAQRQRVDERPDDDVAALLGARRVDVVEVQRVVVHRDQAEEVVVGLGHGLRRPVLVDGADLELLEVAAVGCARRTPRARPGRWSARTSARSSLGFVSCRVGGAACYRTASVQPP